MTCQRFFLHRVAAILAVLLATCVSVRGQEELQKPREFNGNKSDTKKPPIIVRSLQQPRQMHDSKSQKPNQVIIYYANESAPIGVERTAYDRVIAVLEKHQDPMVQSMILGFKMDPIVFPYTVDFETAQLAQTVQFSGYRENTSLIVFTNRLARRGKALLIDPKQLEPMSEIDFALEGLDSEARRANPLAIEASLKQALHTTAERFAPETHEFLLILKSHASSKNLVTPRLMLKAATIPEEKIVSTFEEVARPLKESLAEGQSLLLAGQAFVDQDGHGIKLVKNRLLHEKRGPLFVLTNTAAVIDGRGEPVIAADGQALSLLGGQLVNTEGIALFLNADAPMNVRPNLQRTAQTAASHEKAGLDVRQVQSIQVQPMAQKKLVAANQPATSNLPQLGVDQKLSDGPTLNGNDSSTLAKYNTGDFLNGNDWSTLAKYWNAADILGGTDIDGAADVGITREQFAELLTQVSTDKGMYFPLVFLESCHSSLPEASFRRLEASERIGVMWTSDPAGLQFRTVDYNKLSSRHGQYPELSGALNAALWDAYKEQHPEEQPR
jgi:hypothetical protein